MESPLKNRLSAERAERAKRFITPVLGLVTYRLKITLDLIKPAIWRRLSVPGNVGWPNSHLHQFEVGGRLIERQNLLISNQ
jgi:hypothetical protein